MEMNQNYIFVPGFVPDAGRCGTLRCFPRPPSRLGWGHPSTFPLNHDAFCSSISAPRFLPVPQYKSLAIHRIHGVQVRAIRTPPKILRTPLDLAAAVTC